MAQLRDNLTMDLYGDEELDRFFHEALTFDQQKRVFLDAYRKASKPLINDAKNKLRSRRKSPGSNSNLSKSLGTRAMKSKAPALIIGARKWGGFKGHHGHLVDSGTKMRQRGKMGGNLKNKNNFAVKSLRIRKRGGSTGQMRGNQFWADALISSEHIMRETIKTELYGALDRLVQRNLKKQAKTTAE